jgi:hypothetical protein
MSVLPLTVHIYFIVSYSNRPLPSCMLSVLSKPIQIGSPNDSLTIASMRAWQSPTVFHFRPATMIAAPDISFFERSPTEGGAPQVRLELLLSGTGFFHGKAV